MPKASKKKQTASDSDSGPEDRTPVKKAKQDGEDENTWVLEKLRMVKVSEFHGKTMIDIREHYDADGVIKPGKKGISLSVPQWKKLCSVMDEINKKLDSS